MSKRAQSCLAKKIALYYRMDKSSICDKCSFQSQVRVDENEGNIFLSVSTYTSHVVGYSFSQTFFEKKDVFFNQCQHFCLAYREIFFRRDSAPIVECCRCLERLRQANLFPVDFHCCDYRKNLLYFSYSKTQRMNVLIFV